MKRTNKLLSSVITSLLALSSPDRAISMPVGSDQLKTTQGVDDWKTDPKVAEIAERVFKELQSKQWDEAKTVPELKKKLSKLSTADIELGLKRLIYEARIRRFGDGSDRSPYRYYERNQHSG